MKKQFIILIYIFLCFQFVNLSFSSGYLVDNPIIITDKYEYYPLDSIHVNANWFLYKGSDEIIEIKLIFMTQIHDNESKIYEINCPVNDGETNFYQEIPYSLLSLNYTYKSEIWISLVFIKNNIEDFIYDKSLILSKFNPVFENQSQNISGEYNEDMIFSDKIIPQQNYHIPSYFEESYFYAISHNSQRILGNYSNITAEGIIFIPLSSSMFNNIGDYQLFISFNDTNYFNAKDFIINISIVQKKLKMICENDTSNYIPLYYKQVSLEILLINNQNIFFMENPSWIIKSDIIFDQFHSINNHSYLLYFYSPKIEGNYYINITLNNSNYCVENLLVYLNFGKCCLNLSLAIVYINFEQNVTLKIEEKNSEFLKNINYNALKLLIFENKNWNYINFNFISIDSNEILISVEWKHFDKTLLSNNLTINLKIIYLGDNTFFTSYSEIFSLNFSLYLLKTFEMNIINGKYRNKCLIFDFYYKNNQFYNFSINFIESFLHLLCIIKYKDKQVKINKTSIFYSNNTIILNLDKYWNEFQIKLDSEEEIIALFDFSVYNISIIRLEVDIKKYIQPEKKNLRYYIIFISPLFIFIIPCIKQIQRKIKSLKKPIDLASVVY